jgi:hypothetical protein
MADTGLPLAPSGPDPALAERILAEEPIVLDEQARLQDWASMVADRVLEWFQDQLGTLELPPGTGETLLWVLGLLLVVALLVLVSPLARRVAGLLRPRQQGELAFQAPVSEPTPPGDRYQACLEAGDARGALGALWERLAQQLAEREIGHFGPEVTHREFVASVRRTAPGFAGMPPLRQLTRATDWLLYGGEVFDVGQVQALEPLAEAVLA